MNLFIFFVFCFIGSIISSFSLGNIILILLFSIPFTNKLDKLNVLTNKKMIISSSITAIIFQICILTGATCLVYFLANKYLTAYFIGMVFPTLGVLFQSGENENNISDYLASYNQFINIEKLKEFFNSK